MKHAETSVNYFKDGFLCSQAVFAAFSEEYGLSAEQALKIGACFGSGMCKGEVCGAVSGALMVLGLRYGQYQKDDCDSRKTTNALTCRLLERFQAEHGSYLCRDLLGYDLSIPEDIQRAREAGVFGRICPKMVEAAAQLVEDILAAEANK